MTRISRALFLIALSTSVVVGASNRVKAASEGMLPDYRPRAAVTGTIRVSGNDSMAKLLSAWQAGFRRHHPQARFEIRLQGTGSGIYGLEMRTADIALMGRAMNPFERYGTYERAWVYPVEIEVATGSARTAHFSPAFAILVHRDNPLQRISLEQLDGIFGAERGGGWDALSWRESSARPASENLRTWGQLGLSGDWAAKPIHPYGPPLQGAGVTTFFQARVLKGGDLWNEELREYEDRAQMIRELARDPLGIAYAPLAYATPDVKAIPVGENSSGPFVDLSAKSVADRSYPLARPVYVVYTIDDERSEISEPRVTPAVEEFLRYLLSRQGQQDVASEGNYLPLTRAVIDAQLSKIESKAVPPEKELLWK